MTMGQPAVAVLHPGQMGAAVAAELRSSNIPVYWCPTGRSAKTAVRAHEAGLESVPDLAALIQNVDVVLSICPPELAEHVARQVAAHNFTGTYVDANAVSPQRMRRIEELIAAGGAVIVDGAIIGPPPRAPATARIYLAGTPSNDVAAIFAGTHLEAVVLDGPIGTASGLKMTYASYQKATRTLAAVAHALAADLGVTEHLIAEAQRNPGSPLVDPAYLPSVAARAWRWAPELRDAATTLRQHDLPADLATAAAAVLDRWRGDKDKQLPIATVLEQLHTDALDPER